MTFFNVALVSVADSRLAGGHATVNDGLEVAWQRKGKIFQWALFSATVGIVLRMIQERSAWLGRLITGLVGIGWTLASYFVLPLLAAEDVGPAEALQRSAEMFRETWGEQVTGGFSFWHWPALHCRSLAGTLDQVESQPEQDSRSCTGCCSQR